MKSKHCLLAILTIALSAIITSCSLEEDPEYSLNTNTVFSDQNTAETALMQAYGHLGSSSLYGQFLHEVTIANGFSWAKTDGERRERASSYDTYAKEGLLSAVWQGFYKVIAESNYLIIGLERSSLSQEYIDRSIAHARFLRGFAYYKLANLFGRAVVITNPISTANLHAPRKAADTPTNPDYDFEALPEQVLGVWESTYAWDRNLWPFNKKMTSVEASNNYDPKNMVIFRYADLLLLMADVENELGNTSVGLTYLNRVLTRARESGQGGEYPKNQTNLSQDELRDKIFYERMFELAGEPEMYEDVRRRGTEYLREVIEIHNQSKNVKFRYEFEAANGVGGQFRDYEIKNISEDFLRKNLLLPISADEITSNEELSLEDQNFGY